MRFQLYALLIFLLAGGVAIQDLHAQSASLASANSSNKEEEEDFVAPVKIGEGGAVEDTLSGEKEGVDAAPEFIPIPETKGGEEPLEDPGKPEDLPGFAGRTDAASETFANSRKNARIMSMRINPPRGQILDRNGLPLAQSKVAYQLALDFSLLQQEDRDDVLAFAHKCLEEAHKIAAQTWDFTGKDDMLWEYYTHRRWLLLPITNAISAEDAEKIKEKVKTVDGLELLPIYVRYYPEGMTAAHIIGYVGSKGKLPMGPIGHMDPLWEQSEGKAGLEAVFDENLRGRPGVRRLMFDEDGNKILDELQIRPKPGGSVVTTIDLKWQQAAEQILAKNARRGALIIMDTQSGEILAMASTPSFDPNKFIPNISQKDYDALRNDPANPLVSRAFQGVYPPASTFKVITVLAALGNGTLTENQIVNCPASIQVGNHVFNNWTKTPLGSANCIRALAMSNNPFMYQVALNLDGHTNARRATNAQLCAKVLTDTARKMGFGSPTGLPIPDKAGLIPDEQYMVRNQKRNTTQGDVANMAIGQGVLLATPLQVVHAVSGIANGHALPKLHLIKQVQDGNANVIYRAVPEAQTSLAGWESATASVRKGMQAVVEGGTGSRAKLSYTSIAGKTGTAQWGNERENRRLGWFTGFLPCDRPRLAFVALYEGAPNEAVGGSSKALPIVKKFFDEMRKDVQLMLNPALDESIPVAEPVEEPTPAITPTPRNGAAGDTIPAGEPVVGPAVGGEIDDRADAPADEPAEPGLIPRPGDSDYIPGLNEQIPRNLVPGQGDDVDAIPIAEPVVEE